MVLVKLDLIFQRLNFIDDKVVQISLRGAKGVVILLQGIVINQWGRILFGGFEWMGDCTGGQSVDKDFGLVLEGVFIFGF